MKPGYSYAKHISAAILLGLILCLAGCAGVTSKNGNQNSSPTAPSINSQPASQTVTVGQAATFTVIATGTAPFSYQWQKNGTAISGATSSSYTTPPTTAADNGAKFQVVITNSAGSMTSVVATLTVSPDVVLQSIAVTPANPSISQSQTQQFTATGTYSDNSTKNITTSVTWASSNAGVATIGTSSGLATSVTAGTAKITATLGSVVSPSDSLTVTAATLKSIAVTPANPSISQSQTQQFTATGTYSDSSTKNITTSVTWASSNTGVATIGTSSGLATSVTAGTAKITATLGSVVSPS
ncbi:MAG: Ig-like domain-containing protein, partial [Terriglobia bacterium]